MSEKISFSNDDSYLLTHDSNTTTQLTLNDPYNYLDIKKCLEFIISSNFCNVCLQFPDELLNYANYVSVTVEKETGVKCKILADTSYGSCCIDEVAAEHMNADCVIHFGYSCLSLTEKLPVLYVFGKSTFCFTSFISKLQQNVSIDNHVLVFYDVIYNDIVMSSKEKILNIYPNMVISSLSTSHKDIATFEPTLSKCFGRIYNLKDDIQSYKIVYIGEESLTLNNLILKFNKNETFSYSPVNNAVRREGLKVNKFLMKRFYLIEKAKDANIVGIVIGTLGVAKYKKLLERIKLVLKKASKKFYVFVVGKVNIPKMANFMEIDIFVMIACPENSLIDSKEYFKPIITPYEIEIACLKSRDWTGEYLTEFGNLLFGESHYVDLDLESESNDEPDYSFITGKLRNSNLDNKKPFGNSKDVAVPNSQTDIVCQQPMNALDYYSSRTWQGLDASDTMSEVKLAHAGRSGIAMNYVNETNSQ